MDVAFFSHAIDARLEKCAPDRKRFPNIRIFLQFWKFLPLVGDFFSAPSPAPLLADAGCILQLVMGGCQ